VPAPHFARGSTRAARGERDRRRDGMPSRHGSPAASGQHAPTPAPRLPYTARVRRAVVLLALVALASLPAACKGSSSSGARGGAAASAARKPAAPSDVVAAILDGLASDHEESQKSARKMLDDLVDEGLRPADGVALIRGTDRRFPKPDAGIVSPQADILRAVAKSPDPSFVFPVHEVFPQLDGRAKTAALELLAAVDTPEAALTFVDLVKFGASESPELEVSAPAFDESHHHAEILFPALLDAAHGEAADGIGRLALSYAGEGLLRGDDLVGHTGPVLAEYGRLHARLAPLQRGPDAGTAWVAQEDYSDARATAGVLLDLFGWIPSPDTDRALHEALSLRDPRLVGYATASLVRRGATVPPPAFELAAASAESRASLFEMLSDQERGDLFPARWATQAALAESVLVRWLEFPTELGRPPTAIQLMKVVSEDVAGDHGIMDWYLFRFRSTDDDWKKHGWMAGVAGPFERKSEPTTRDWGDTFSEFEEWASQSPEAHVASVRETIAQWREKQKQEQEQQEKEQQEP